MHTLVTGGARSGKSRYAVEMARQAERPVLFVATAEALDDDMGERIARHRRERPGDWQVLEEPRRVGQRLEEELEGLHGETVVVVLDCLTLLVSNLLLAGPLEQAEVRVEREIEGILRSMSAGNQWIVVTNEVGAGVVPDHRVARSFRDLLGRANQRFAAAVDQVLLLVCGLPVTVK